MPFTKRRLVILIIFGVIFSIIGYVAYRDPDAEEDLSLIQIEPYQESAETFDRDGDGVPDWLEDVAGSDKNDSTSFPHKSDITFSADELEKELVYEGPSEFTKDISRRLILGIDDVDSLTDRQKDRFVSDSTDYFLNEVDKQSLPEVVLRTDDTVPRREVLLAFVQALREASKFERSINEYVVELFSQSRATLREATRALAYCDRSLELFPRAVPSDVFPHYFIVLERFTYICKALSIAVSSNRSEDYFFALFLLNTGALYAPLPEGETVEERIAVVNERLRDAVAETYYRLKQEM